MSLAMWKSAEVPPEKAGTYLVGNRDTGDVAIARYMPKKKVWKFPSAALAFEVHSWDSKPGIAILERDKKDC